MQYPRNGNHPFGPFSAIGLTSAQTALYEKLREGIPVIDAAILKIVRLTGGFSVMVGDKPCPPLEDFLQRIPSSCGTGMDAFVAAYLDCLLTYGNAVAEMVVDTDTTDLIGLYLANPSDVAVEPTADTLGVTVYCKDGMTQTAVANQHLVLFTPLNPKVGNCYGDSVLSGLPFVSDILLKIYHSMGQNFERVGNVRYAITYKPGNDVLDRSLARERAEQIASQWAAGMEAVSRGQIQDFIAVGDVDIKVIGADNPILQSEIPARQMLEQIVAKLGVPPFLLGLNWSTTERMSKQQTDILITEINYYRRLLTPMIQTICETFLVSRGIYQKPTVAWHTINLQDEVESAQARYYHAKADQLEE